MKLSRRTLLALLFSLIFGALFESREYPTLVMAGKSLAPMAKRGDFLIRGVDNFRCLGRRVDATVVREISEREFIIRIDGELVRLIFDEDEKENIRGMADRMLPDIVLSSLYWSEDRRYHRHLAWRWPVGHFVSGRSYRRQPCEA